MKNEIVVNEEKGFTRVKLRNFRTWDKRTKAATKGITFFAYIYSDKVRIVRLDWWKNYQSVLKKKTQYCTIKYIKGNFNLSANGRRCTFAGVNRLTSSFSQYKKTVCPGEDKSLRVRLTKVLKKFANSLGHILKTNKDDDLNKILSKLIYPSLQRIESPCDFSSSFYPKVRSLLKLHLSLKEIIKRLIKTCGKKTYKLVCEKIKTGGVSCCLDRLAFWSRRFNVDKLQRLMENPLWVLNVISTENRDVYYLRQSEKFLAQFTDEKLLSNTDFINWRFYEDSIRMWIDEEEVEIPRGMSIKEAHDWLAVRRGRTIKREKDYSLILTKDMKSIDGMKIDDYTIIVPKTSGELVNWGNRMDNCIASYASSMQRGDLQLFAVMEGEDMKYNVMIKKNTQTNSIPTYMDGEIDTRSQETDSYTCPQFYGKMNSRVDKEIKQKILSSLPIQINAKLNSLGEW